MISLPWNLSPSLRSFKSNRKTMSKHQSFPFYFLHQYFHESLHFHISYKHQLCLKVSSNKYLVKQFKNQIRTWASNNSFPFSLVLEISIEILYTILPCYILIFFNLESFFYFLNLHVSKVASNINFLEILVSKFSTTFTLLHHFLFGSNSHSF